MHVYTCTLDIIHAGKKSMLLVLVAIFYSVTCDIEYGLKSLAKYDTSQHASHA